MAVEAFGPVVAAAGLPKPEISPHVPENVETAMHATTHVSTCPKEAIQAVQFLHHVFV